MLQELPTGARLATMTCYNCWKERKFPTAEFISFLQSIAAHSPLLAQIFANNPISDGSRQSRAEAGGHSDAMRDTGSSPSAARAAGGHAFESDQAISLSGEQSEVAGDLGVKTNPSLQSTSDEDYKMSDIRAQSTPSGRHGVASSPGQNAPASGECDVVAAVDGMTGCGYQADGDGGEADTVSMPDSNGEAEPSVPQESETDRIQHQRRLAEIERRRLEGTEIGKIKGEELPYQKKVCRYLCNTLKELVASLPLASRGAFMVVVQRYVGIGFRAEEQFTGHCAWV